LTSLVISDDEKVSAYIDKHQQWSKQLSALRKQLLSTELVETVKWGAPSYTLDKKIVVSLVGFKTHCALWFTQGVFLTDESKVLINAQEGTTKGLRQWRFEIDDKVNTKLVKTYIVEAIANQKAGKQIKSEKKQLAIPPELQGVLNKNAKISKSFEKLSPGKQREYADHIASAKQEKTRLSRLEKALPMIQQGIGLNDSYKNR